MALRCYIYMVENSYKKHNASEHCHFQTSFLFICTKQIKTLNPGTFFSFFFLFYKIHIEYNHGFGFKIMKWESFASPPIFSPYVSPQNQRPKNGNLNSIFDETRSHLAARGRSDLSHSKNCTMGWVWRVPYETRWNLVAFMMVWEVGHLRSY